MTKARIRFSTEILARLGEELNPSLDQGVIELVKNAHDADAKRCVVTLTDVESEGGKLGVWDDGDGMTSGELEEKFLLLGSSAKDVRRRTRLGRIPAGSKGLGRLAALRSGTSVKVETRSRVEPSREHSLAIDWAEFESSRIVDEVILEIKSYERAPKAPSGTSIVVHDLRRRVGRSEVKRLARSLVLLADPFGDTPNAFRPILESEEYGDLANLVEQKYFDAAEYHLKVELNSEGYCTGQVLDWQARPLFSAQHLDIRQGPEPYQAPAATFDLWVYILDARTFSTRANTVGEVRTWLAEFGGVMLYINGLRVTPYGDPGNDWLDMNLRRVRNPEERPGTNTSIGRVQVTDQSSVLQSKTDRGGLIENEAFDDLRRMATDSLEWMARERMTQAEIRRQRERQEAPRQSSRRKEKVEEAIARSTAAEDPELKSAFSSYDRARERELKALRDEVQLYRTLSTAGITAATFAHEASNGPLKVIGRAVGTLFRRIRGIVNPIPAEVNEPLTNIKMSAESLASFGDTTLELISKDKRRTGRVEINAAVKTVLDSYLPFLTNREIEVTFRSCNGTPFLQGSIAAVESIVVNLLTNAMTSLSSSSTRTRRIEISTEMAGDHLILSVADNGAGLRELNDKEIWLPGESTRPGGSGLGLTIVRDTVSDLGGSAAVIESGSLGGLDFRILLPVLGS